MPYPPMLPVPTPPVFSNAAGVLEAHPAGYVVLRLAAEHLEVGALSELFTQAGALLLRHGWRGLLVNVEAVESFDQAVLTWLLRHWLAQKTPQPLRLSRALVMPTAPAALAAIGVLRDQFPAQARYAYFAHEADAHHYLTTLLS